jgi:hypothetical protein
MGRAQGAGTIATFPPVCVIGWRRLAHLFQSQAVLLEQPEIPFEV